MQILHNRISSNWEMQTFHNRISLNSLIRTLPSLGQVGWKSPQSSENLRHPQINLRYPQNSSFSSVWAEKRAGESSESSGKPQVVRNSGEPLWGSPESSGKPQVARNSGENLWESPGSSGKPQKSSGKPQTEDCGESVTSLTPEDTSYAKPRPVRGAYQKPL